MGPQTKKIEKALKNVKFEYDKRSQSTEFYLCRNKEDGSLYDIEIKKSLCDDYEDGIMRVVLQAQKLCSDHIGDAGDCFDYYKVYTEKDFKYSSINPLISAFGSAYHSYLQNKNFADEWLNARESA